MTLKLIKISIMLIEFISFWLVAPELLGPKGIAKAKNMLITIVKSLPLLFAIVLGYLSYSVPGYFEENLEFSFLWISIPLLAILILLSSRIGRWIEYKLAVPIIDKLINEEKFRSGMLKTGVILFIAAFIGQVIMEFI